MTTDRRRRRSSGIPGIPPDFVRQPVGRRLATDHDEHCACRFLDESQHPTTPQVVHQRRWTQVSPNRTHGTHSSVGAVSTRIMPRWLHRVPPALRQRCIANLRFSTSPSTCSQVRDGRSEWRGVVAQPLRDRRDQSSSASCSTQSRAGPSTSNSSFIAASRSSAALTRIPVAPHCRANSAQSGFRSDVCHTG